MEERQIRETEICECSTPVIFRKSIAPTFRYALSLNFVCPFALLSYFEFKYVCIHLNTNACNVNNDIHRDSKDKKCSMGIPPQEN